MLKNKNSKLRPVKINLETSNFLFLIPHSPGHGKKLYSVQNFRKVYFWAKMKHSSVYCIYVRGVHRILSRGGGKNLKNIPKCAPCRFLPPTDLFLNTFKQN